MVPRMDGEQAQLVEVWAVCPGCVRMLHLRVADILDVARVLSVHERFGCSA